MDARTMPTAGQLASIPLIDTGSEGPLAMVAADPHRFERVIAMGRARYGRLGLVLGDKATRRWLARTSNPYEREIAAVAAHSLGVAQGMARGMARGAGLVPGTGVGPGAWLLNLSYEWSCTTGVTGDPDHPGSRMLRTLDWPLDGLGRLVVVARHEGQAGPYYNVTWPGFIGVVTAMAPGRFSAAVNQPPMKRRTPSCWLDWPFERLNVWRRRDGLPPVHLLRRVFDSCRTFGEARAMLTETPLSIPAFFSLSGAEAEEGCIIERRENEAALHQAPASITNHWRKFSIPSHQRGEDSAGRLDSMNRVRDVAANDFSWVTPPILNPTTRLAVIANAKAEKLMVQGFEAGGPATEVFSL